MPSGKTVTAGILATLVGASFYNVIKAMNRDPLLDELDKMDRLAAAAKKR